MLTIKELTIKELKFHSSHLTLCAKLTLPCRDCKSRKLPITFLLKYTITKTK